ncbi:MAG: bifunctional oligoribonuclease/PAP phosphatase NrnA [Actinomycetota bacterium]
MSQTSKGFFGEAAAAIEAHNDIVLVTHILPDGDAIGSLIGLALILRKLNKNVVASWGNRFAYPPQYSFLEGQEVLVSPDKLPDRPQVLVALDCGGPERLGSLEKLLKTSELTINVDHHRNNSGYAMINAVAPDFASTAEMVFEIGKDLGVSLDKAIAENLYTGLVTDTGRFQYSNTTAGSFVTAAELIGYGVDPARIFRHIYENTTFERLKLAGVAFSKAVFDEATGLIYTAITKTDFVKTGSSIEDTENLIDSLRAVKGISVAAVFKETDAGWRVSLRSTGKIDVGALAEAKKGGGHRLAAGYTATGGLDESLQNLRISLAGGNE